MEGDVEKREVSTGGNGRYGESERLIPGRVIIGTSAGGNARIGVAEAPVCNGRIKSGDNPLHFHYLTPLPPASIGTRARPW
jgi:hypothetical protein